MKSRFDSLQLMHDIVLLVIVFSLSCVVFQKKNKKLCSPLTVAGCR